MTPTYDDMAAEADERGVPVEVVEEEWRDELRLERAEWRQDAEL